jgi:hypothetical protein
MAKELISFIGRLHSDAALRKRFVKAPARTLSEEGFDAEALALPDRIDERALVAKLDKAVAGDRTFAARLNKEAAQTDLAKLTPNQLWERFGLIRSKAEIGSDQAAANAAAIVVAVVIYGVSIVLGPATVIGSVSTVAQLKALRQLTQVPQDQLRFSVKGPDGAGVKELTADALRAFLHRVAGKP